MKSKLSKIIKILIIGALCTIPITYFSGCTIFNFYNSIGAVRERVEKLRYEMSEQLINGFKSKNVSALNRLFCPKTQGLLDTEKQIKASLSFMSGNISTYQISKSTSYEGYSTSYGTVEDYSFDSDIYITTDTGRKYALYFNVKYIVDDASIEGMTSYTVSENDVEYPDNKKYRVGYNWSSPYDGECGIVSAKLIKAIGNSDLAGVKSLLCQKTNERPETDAELESTFEFFDGNPIFTERSDGLYNYSDDENDFSCRTLAYEKLKDGNGSLTGVWVSVLTQPVCTDTGKKYRLDFVAYLENTVNMELIGISSFSIRDWQTDEEIQVGTYIHEEH